MNPKTKDNEVPIKEIRNLLNRNYSGGRDQTPFQSREFDDCPWADEESSSVANDCTLASENDMSMSSELHDEDSSMDTGDDESRRGCSSCKTHDVHAPEENPNVGEHVILYLPTLLQLLEQTCCKNCAARGERHTLTPVVTHHGLASQLVLTCTNASCAVKVEVDSERIIPWCECPPSPPTINNRAINYRIVMAMQNVGLGSADLAQILGCIGVKTSHTMQYLWDAWYVIFSHLHNPGFVPGPRIQVQHFAWP